MTTKTPTIVERLSSLEEAVKSLDLAIADQDQRIANILSSVTAQLKSVLEDTLMLVEAGHEVLAHSINSTYFGKTDILELIEKEVNTKKQAKLVKVFESNKARFMQEVEAGKFTKVNKIVGNPILIGTATNADGSPYGAGHFLSVLQGLGKEMADFFINKEVGTTYTSKDGIVVVVDEIYEASK